MKLVLGNITFEDMGKKAIVHEINGIINCDTMIGKTEKEVAMELGLEMVNMFDAYIIPEVFDGKIIYECDTSIDVHTHQGYEK